MKAKSPVRTKTKRSCHHCGEAFFVRYSKPNQKFCSVKCCHEGTRVVQRVEATCDHCGEDFEYRPRKGGPPKRFCTRACYHASRADKRHICKQCGEPFEKAPSKGQKYCSQRCDGDAKRDSYTGPYIEMNPNDHEGLAAWVAKRWTRERPVRRTDEYQSAWLGLIYACRYYRGTRPFARWAIECMTRSIREDLYGTKFVLQRKKDLKRTTGLLGLPCREPLPIQSAVTSELCDVIAAEVKQLGPQARRIVRAIVFNGQTTDQVAKMLNITRNSVTQQFWLAKKKLIASIRWSWSGLDGIGREAA